MTQAVCAVCEAGPPKNKCPTCFAPDCSVACCRVHKETPCQRPDPAETSPAANGGHGNGSHPPAQGPGDGTGQASSQPRRPFEDDSNEEEAQWRLSQAHCLSIAEDGPCACS